MRAPFAVKLFAALVLLASLRPLQAAETEPPEAPLSKVMTEGGAVFYAVNPYRIAGAAIAVGKDAEPHSLPEAALFSSATWSPDGHYLAAFSGGSIWVLDTRSQKIKTLPVSIANVWVLGSLSWSPDGERLVFSMSRPGRLSVLYTVDKDGQNLKQILSAPNLMRWPVWSYDGRQIAFAVEPARDLSGDDTRGLYVVDSNGANKRLVITGRITSAPSWSPDSKQLAFTGQHVGDSKEIGTDLFTVRGDGTELRQLTHDVIYESYPGWLASGYILYCRDRQMDGRTGQRLMAVKTDGTDTVALSKPNESATRASVRAVIAPDLDVSWFDKLPDAPGTRTPVPAAPGPALPVNPPPVTDANPPYVAPEPPPANIVSGTAVFHSNRDGNDEVYLLRTDGSALRLTNNMASDGGAVASADGKRIAFTSKRDGNLEVYVVNADGSGLKRLTNNPASDIAGSWSPVEDLLAFYSNRGGNYDIYATTADETVLVQLTSDEADDIEPAYNPDGTKIAFASKRSGNYEIYVMDNLGKNVVRLTSNGLANREPAWSPDGKQIVWSAKDIRNEDIFLMNADGTKQIHLTALSEKNVRPTFLGPDTVLFASNRDGNMQLYTMKSDGSDVKRLTNDKSVDLDPYAIPQNK